MPQPGKCLVQKELHGLRSNTVQRCLVSTMQALGWLPALHFHHTVAGICPWAVAPGWA